MNKEECILFSAFIPLEDSSINSKGILALPQSGCLTILNLTCSGLWYTSSTLEGERAWSHQNVSPNR